MARVWFQHYDKSWRCSKTASAVVCACVACDNQFVVICCVFCVNSSREVCALRESAFNIDDRSTYQGNYQFKLL